MPKESITALNRFIGLRVYEDPTKAPPGSAKKMVNQLISDRGGITKRPGVKLLGNFNSASDRCDGFTVFRKTDSVTEIPIKKYGDKVEYYFENYGDWALLKDSYRDPSNVGFVHGFIRSGNDDWIHYGNREEYDTRWNGAVTQLNGALAGGESTITVDSVLRPDIYDDQTASASAATTLDVASAIWAASQWINFFVHITSGVHSGKVRRITANTSTQITFDTLGSDPGSCTFEIRYPLFSETGTLIYNGTEIAYSAMPTATTFTVTNAHAAADNSPVTVIPTTYPANPRGNRMVVLRGRRYVGNVRSGLLRDSAGTLSGAAQPGAVFVSKVVNATNLDGDLIDFTFADPRAAGEGDVIAGAYGGEGITDLAVHDDGVYMLRPHAIEAIKYSQDTNDVAQIEQISTSYGAITRPISGFDDLFFFTSDKQLTSISRVLLKADKEQAINIGLPVKRLLQSYGYDKNSKGAAYRNRLHLPVKNTDADTAANRLLIYNMNGFFEGEWWLPIDGMDIFNNDLYASLSNGPNVVKMYEGLNDKLGIVSDNSYEFPITSIYESNWINQTSNGFNQQEVNLFLCEGYILGGTSLDFKLYKNLQTSPFLQFTFAGTDDAVDDDFLSHFLGSLPLGIEPIGGISTNANEDGMKHFMFMVYFPFEHAEWISWGFTNTGLNQNYEITRAGMNYKEDTILDFANRLKEIN